MCKPISTAVGSLANVPLVMVVNPAKGYKTIHDFVAAAKAKPGTFTYGSGGRGDATHLAAERFRLAAGFEGLYVPFRGAPEVLTEVMAGRLDFYMSPVAPAMPLITGGKLQALAVASAKRGDRAAGRADDHRAGLRQFRLRVLGRRVRACRDAARAGAIA